MAIIVYISGICGSHEVRKQQQRVLFILQSLPIDLLIIDITEPGREEDLIQMQEVAKKHNKKTQLPPQIFNGDDYCGDYADFEMANDDDQILRFLKLEEAPSKSETVSQNGVDDLKTNGVSDALDEQSSNEISENNVEKEQDAELISPETDQNEVKDSEIETSVSENVEKPQADADESNEVPAVEEKEELSEESEKEEESE